jgi:hypothetical protein
VHYWRPGITWRTAIDLSDHRRFTNGTGPH